MSESEEITMCLNCTKDYCDDCLSDTYSGSNRRVTYEWQGRRYNVKELAEIKGFKYEKMRYRIKTGGLEFAMSDYRTKKGYDMAQMDEKETIQ